MNQSPDASETGAPFAQGREFVRAVPRHFEVDSRRGFRAAPAFIAMNDDIRDWIRTVPDFPRPGVMFRDITTLLKHPLGFRTTIDRLHERFAGAAIGKVAGVESRGFIVGAALAYRLGAGFVPIRKAGKLPAENFGQDYELEYGSDRLEMHRDAVSPGERVLLIDDLIATGGTALATVRLLEAAAAKVVACGFVIDLPALGGRGRLEALGHPVYALCDFPGH